MPFLPDSRGSRETAKDQESSLSRRQQGFETPWGRHLLSPNPSANDMKKDETYVGLDQDIHGGMTDIGRIVRDAQAFGLIPDHETCAGWTAQGIEKLWERVQQCWREYGFSVSHFPAELRARYVALQESAIARAREQGWNPDLDLEDEA